VKIYPSLISRLLLSSIVVSCCFIPLHPTAGPNPIDFSALHPAGLMMSPDHWTPQMSCICPRSCSPSLLSTYLVVGILTDIHFLRLSTSFVFDRQLFLVVRYRYDFYFNNPVVYKACTVDSGTLVRISTWASTRPILSSSPRVPLCPVSVGTTRPDSDTVRKVLSTPSVLRP